MNEKGKETLAPIIQNRLQLCCVLFCFYLKSNDSLKLEGRMSTTMTKKFEQIKFQEEKKNVVEDEKRCFHGHRKWRILSIF